jgi:hypothetical protein
MVNKNKKRAEIIVFITTFLIKYLKTSARLKVSRQVGAMQVCE